MKKSGMRWSIDGGQTVLTLRSIILSNRWEKFWAYFIPYGTVELKSLVASPAIPILYFDL